MTITEAEQLYKKFDGNLFYMNREEPHLYEDFKQLNISSEILINWNQEIIETLFNELSKDSNMTFWVFMRLFELIKIDKNNLEKNIERYFNEIRKTKKLDYLQRIILIELFAGKDAYQKTGICFFVCNNITKYINEMNEIVMRLMDFSCKENKELNKRFDEAKKNYKKAFTKFSKINKKNNIEIKKNNTIGFHYGENNQIN